MPAKSSEYFVKINQDGEVMFLFHDDHVLSGVGEQNVIRASNVHFDNAQGLWFVEENLPDGTSVRHANGFKKRADAIAFEVLLLSVKIGDKDYVESMFKQYLT
jgi:hypothetical protein